MVDSVLMEKRNDPPRRCGRVAIGHRVPGKVLVEAVGVEPTSTTHPWEASPGSVTGEISAPALPGDPLRWNHGGPVFHDVMPPAYAVAVP